MKFTMSCPITACEGALTVDVSGRCRPARGFDPPEEPEFEILKATCSHGEEADLHPQFVEQAFNALKDYD